MATVKVIIPAYNEEGSIGKVVDEVPKDVVNEVIVCNNNSKDNTVAVAEAAGATVVHEPTAGYGNACLKGMEYIAQLPKEQQLDIVVFIDGDYSDYPAQIPDLIADIVNDKADMVIGSRVLGKREKGSLTPQQRYGNWLATTLIKWFYGFQFSDLGPFRAIRYSSLLDLQMEDKTYGWTVEMQVKALKKGLRCTEVPVDYRNRIGISKVSGTIKGVIMAGYKIIFTIFKYL